MAGLVPAIHVWPSRGGKTWMTGTRPVMPMRRSADFLSRIDLVRRDSLDHAWK